MHHLLVHASLRKVRLHVELQAAHQASDHATSIWREEYSPKHNPRVETQRYKDPPGSEGLADCEIPANGEVPLSWHHDEVYVPHLPRYECLQEP